MCLIFIVTPIIAAVSQPNDILLGQSVAIFCLATGFPLPTFSWQHDGSDIAENDIIDFFTFLPQRVEEFDDFMVDGSALGSGGGSIFDLLMMNTEFDLNTVTSLRDLRRVGLLRISSVVPEDTGNYTCTASNQLPQTTVLTAVSTPVSLLVLGK